MAAGSEPASDAAAAAAAAAVVPLRQLRSLDVRANCACWWQCYQALYRTLFRGCRHCSRDFEDHSVYNVYNGDGDGDRRHSRPPAGHQPQSQLLLQWRRQWRRIHVFRDDELLALVGALPRLETLQLRCGMAILSAAGVARAAAQHPTLARLLLLALWVRRRRRRRWRASFAYSPNIGYGWRNSTAVCKKGCYFGRGYVPGQRTNETCEKFLEFASFETICYKFLDNFPICILVKKNSRGRRKNPALLACKLSRQTSRLLTLVV